MAIDYQKMLWETWRLLEKLNLGQCLVIVVVIYMLPKILYAIFDIGASIVRSAIRMMIFSIIVGIAINLYMGNPKGIGDVSETLHDFMQTGRKGIRSMLDY